MPVSTSQKPLDSAPTSAPWWGRMETLWLLMSPLCALLYTLCLPLAPNDLWYHVRAGELISRGAIPTQNAMSSAVSLDAPYYYQSWLAELGLFQALRISGLSGLMILRAACVTLAFLLVALASFRVLLRRNNPPAPLVAARIAALGAVLGFAMASNNVDLRPQTFSALLFGIWIFAALEFRAARNSRRIWGALLVLLTLIWANTHGAFIISIAGLFALALGDFWARRERFSASISVAAMAAVAALCNPRGAALYAYVANLSRDQISQKYVQEWRSPSFDEWHSVLFWICAGAFVVSLIFEKRLKISASGELGLVFLLGLLGAMASRDQRAMIWFALALAPAMAALLPISAKESTPIAPTMPAAQSINAGLLLFLLLMPLALLPQLKAQLPWPREFARRFAPTPASFGAAPRLILENTTPVAATQWLLKNPPRGRLFTDMVCGSYLTYAGRGQIVPLCDPRIELFPATFWEDYLRLSAGPPDAAQTLQKRGFSDALLDRDSMPALVKRLRGSAEWRVVAGNGTTILFHRAARQIKRVEIKRKKLLGKITLANSVLHKARKRETFKIPARFQVLGERKL